MDSLEKPHVKIPPIIEELIDSEMISIKEESLDIETTIAIGEETMEKTRSKEENFEESTHHAKEEGLEELEHHIEVGSFGDTISDLNKNIPSDNVPSNTSDVQQTIRTRKIENTATSVVEDIDTVQLSNTNSTDSTQDVLHSQTRPNEANIENNDKKEEVIYSDISTGIKM